VAPRGLFYGTGPKGVDGIVAFDTSVATGWRVTAALPSEELSEALNRSLAVLGLTILVLGGLGLALAWAIRRRLKRAITAVSALAAAVGRGGHEALPSIAVSDVASIGRVLLESSRELRETGENLRQSELRLRRVLDNLFAFVGLLDTDGVLIEANNAPLAVAGLQRSDVVGKPFWECYWWDLGPDVKARIRAACMAAAAGETSRFDTEVRITGDNRIVIDFQIAPLRDDRGEIVGLQPSGVDITERFRIQAELARREARSRFLADLREEMDREVEPAAVLRTAARRVGAYLEIDVVTIHEVDQTMDRVMMHTVRSGSEMAPEMASLSATFSPETQRRLIDGETVAVEDVRLDELTRDRVPKFEALGLRACLAVPLQRRGQWVGTIVLGHGGRRDWKADAAFVRVIFERVWLAFENARLLRDLLQSEERLRIGVAVSGLGLGEIDYRNDTVTLDHRAAQIFGVEPGMPMQRADLHACVHADDRPHVLEQVAQLQSSEGRGFFALDHRVQRADGSVRWVAAQKQVIYGPGPDGGRRAVSGFLAVHDVTGRKMAEEALRASEERLRGFATSNVIGMLYGDTEGGVTFANKELLRIIGRTQEDLNAGRVRWDRITPPEWLPVDAEHIAEAMERGASTPYEKEYIRPDGTRVPVLVGFSLSEPDRTQTVAFVLDLTERKRIARVLEETAERLTLSQEAAGISSWESVPGREELTVFSPSVMKLYELPDDWVYTFESWLERIHPDDRERVAARMRELGVGGPEYFEDEFRVRRRDGGWRWLYTRGRSFCDSDGRVVRLAGINMDISLRKELEERQTLLIHELHHRIKNTLATIQAIARSSMRSATSMDDFRRSFGDRLMSLARSHTLLTDNAWAGADLRELITLEVEPYDDRGRITLDGPVVALPPELAVPIGMGLHELATNAAKHGALSSASGRLSVNWRVLHGEEGRKLVLEWRERDGPPVSPASHEGFGSRLLDRVLGPQINGAIRIAYEPAGITATIEAPLADARLAQNADVSVSPTLRVWTGTRPRGSAPA
jgi:PAS domain S-box-containing protein